MGQIHDEIAQPLAERLCWHVTQRDATRIVRRWSRKPLVDGVYRLETGVLLDDCFHFLQTSEVKALLEQVDGTPREILPVLQDLLRYGLKTLFGIDSMHALPPLRCSDDALRPQVGCKAQKGRHGIYQRRAPHGAGRAAPGINLPRYPGLADRQAERAGFGGGVP